MCTPRNFVIYTLSILVLFMLTVGLLTIFYLLITINLFLKHLKNSLFVLNHVFNLSNSVDTLCIFLIHHTLHMSLIYRINKIGTNIEPCDTPHAIFRQVEFVSHAVSCCLDSYVSNYMLQSTRLMPLFLFFSSMLWSTVSNAFF